MTARIYQIVAERALPESYDSATLTERRLESVWASRARLPGAYALAAGMLSRLGAVAPVEDYFVAPCVLRLG